MSFVVPGPYVQEQGDAATVGQRYGPHVAKYGAGVQPMRTGLNSGPHFRVVDDRVEERDSGAL